MAVRVVREWNPANLTRPRLVWFADGSHLSLGGEVADGKCDTVASLVFEIDLTPIQSERLYGLIERTICRLLGHDYHWLGVTTDPKRRAEWDGVLWEQCDRCLHMKERGYVPPEERALGSEGDGA